MNAKLKKLLNGFFLVSLLGWLNAAYTLWHRQKVVGGVAEGKSFCNLSDTFNCDAVAFSKHSLLFGLPVSTWGMLFYTVLILISVWALFSAMDNKEEETSKAVNLLYWVSLLGLIPTAYFAVISYGVLKTVCMMCGLTYVTNILLVILSWQLRKNSTPASAMAGVKALPQSYWIASVILILVQLLSPKMVNNMVAANDADLDDKTVEVFVSRHMSGETHSFNLENVPSYGPADAKVTVVEFSDFQCPFCAKSALNMPSMIGDYKNKVRVVYKNFPLDPACNPEIKSAGHPLACLAAKTGWCVFKLKGNEAFFKYKSSAFEKQAELSAATIAAHAEAVGVDKLALDTCVADYATQQAISEQLAEAKAAKVQGTPAIFVNGKVLEAGFVPKIFKAVMEKY